MKKMTIATLAAIAAFGFSGNAFANGHHQDPMAEACCPLIETGDIDVNDIIVGLGEGPTMKINGNYVSATVNAYQSISDIDVKADDVTLDGASSDPVVLKETTTTDDYCDWFGYHPAVTTVSETCCPTPEGAGATLTVNQSNAEFNSSVGANIAGASFQAFSSPTVLVVGGEYAPTVPSAE